MTLDEKLPEQTPEQKEHWSRIVGLWTSSFKKLDTWLRLLEFLLIISFGFVAGQGLDTRHVVERCNKFIAETYIKNAEFEQCVSLVRSERLPEINEKGMFLNFSHAIDNGEVVEINTGQPNKSIAYQWHPDNTAGYPTTGALV